MAEPLLSPLLPLFIKILLFNSTAISPLRKRRRRAHASPTPPPQAPIHRNHAHEILKTQGNPPLDTSRPAIPAVHGPCLEHLRSPYSALLSPMHSSPPMPGYYRTNPSIIGGYQTLQRPHSRRQLRNIQSRPTSLQPRNHQKPTKTTLP